MHAGTVSSHESNAAILERSWVLAKHAVWESGTDLDLTRCSELSGKMATPVQGTGFSAIES